MPPPGWPGTGSSATCRAARRDRVGLGPTGHARLAWPGAVHTNTNTPTRYIPEGDAGHITGALVSSTQRLEPGRAVAVRRIVLNAEVPAMLVPVPAGRGTFGPAARRSALIASSYDQICRLGRLRGSARASAAVPRLRFRSPGVCPGPGSRRVPVRVMRPALADRTWLGPPDQPAVPA